MFLWEASQIVVQQLRAKMPWSSLIHQSGQHLAPLQAQVLSRHFIETAGIWVRLALQREWSVTWGIGMYFESVKWDGCLIWNVHLPNAIKGYQWENIYWSSQVPTAPVNTLKRWRLYIEGFQWKGHVAGERIEGAFHTEGVLSPLRSLDVFGISIHLSGEATWWLCWAPHHAGLRSCWLGCLQTLPVLAFFPTMHWGVMYGTILESIIAQKEECQVKYVTSCDPRRATMESHWNWLRLYLILLCRPVKSVASNLATPNYQKNKGKPSQDYILSSNHQLQSLYNLTKSLTKRKSPMQGLLSICPVPLEHRQLQEIIEIEIRPQETTRMSWGCKWWGCRGVGGVEELQLSIGVILGKTCETYTLPKFNIAPEKLPSQ